MPTTVSKSTLKARMLEYFREVELTGDELVVTSHGRPVLKVIPFRRREDVATLFQDVRGRVHLPSDAELNEPLPLELWADSDIGDALS